MGERSIWEVRAAAKIVVENIEDLSLHQSMQKRVQVLVSCLANVVTLMTENDETKTDPTANILGSLMEQVPCPPPIEDSQAHIEASICQTSFKRVRSSTTCLSFRAKHNLNKTAAVAQDVKKNLYKFTIDLTPYTPTTGILVKRSAGAKSETKASNNIENCDTPIRRSENGSKIVRRSSARLSSVLDELSALSHELSINLANQDTDTDIINHQENVVKVKSKEVADKVKEIENRGNNSLRRVALKNVTNKITTPKNKNLSPDVSKTSLLIDSFERLRDIENVENKLSVISRCDVISDI